MNHIDTKGVLIVIPDISWRPINFVVTSIVFIWVSHKVAEATAEMTTWICGTSPTKRPLIAPSMEEEVSSTIPISEGSRVYDLAAEESIPLVERTERTPNGDSGEDNVERAPNHKVWTEARRGGAVVPGQVSPQAGSVEPPVTNGGLLPLSFITLHYERSLALPMRIGGVLGLLWLLNLAWPLKAPFL